jgi:hypothetical protein
VSRLRRAEGALQSLEAPGSAVTKSASVALGSEPGPETDTPHRETADQGAVGSFKRGMVAMDSQKCDDAAREFDEALKHGGAGPLQLLARTQLGRAHAQGGRMAAATKQLRAAAALAGTLAETARQRQLLMELARLRPGTTSALEALEEAVGLPQLSGPIWGLSVFKTLDGLRQNFPSSNWCSASGRADSRPRQGSAVAGGRAAAVG